MRQLKFEIFSCYTELSGFFKVRVQFSHDTCTYCFSLKQLLCIRLVQANYFRNDIPRYHNQIMITNNGQPRWPIT